MHLQSEMKIRYDLIAQSFCVIKCYGRIKEIEKAADIDLGRGGGGSKSTPCGSLARCDAATSSLLRKQRQCLRA